MPKVYQSGIADAEVAPDKGAYVAGDYDFEITEATIDSSQRTGRECLKLDLDILDGPADGSGQPVSGRPFTYRVWLAMPSDDPTKADTMRGMLKGFFEKVGVPYDNEGFDTDDLPGLTFRAKLAPQKSNPDYLEIKRVYG